VKMAGAVPEDGMPPTFTILGGRGGSGKSWFKNKVYDPDKAIVIDSDEIKKMLPEYKGWNAAQLHEEATGIFDKITDVAMSGGLNVVHDSTMKSTEKANALVSGFKSAGYSVESHYMFLPRQEAAKRAVHRFLGKTGRFVPPDVVLANTTNEASFDAVKGLCDKWSFRNNFVDHGKEPTLISEGVGSDATDTGKSGLRGLPSSQQGLNDRGASGHAQGGSGRDSGKTGFTKASGADAEEDDGAGRAGRLILFVKAIKVGASGDLITQPVDVQAHVRDGREVAAHTAHRLMVIEEAPNQPRPILILKPKEEAA
jgi:predicted ABC-type ATPase